MWEHRKKIIAEIEKRRGSQLICYLTSDRPGFVGQMARDVVPIFSNHLRRVEKEAKGKVDVLIFTLGGDTLAGFALARLIREFANFVGVLVPGACHSAGTLFALGADEIYMTRSGTLSPIDPSVTTALNPVAAGSGVQLGIQPGQVVPVSVESVTGFKALAADDWSRGGGNRDALITEAFRVLADRVHPLALGDVYRRRQQIELLATELLKNHHKDNVEKIKEIVSRLVTELGSHDYPIYRTEASRLMGDQIRPEDAFTEEQLISLLDDFSGEMRLGVPYNSGVAFNSAIKSGQSAPVTLGQKIAIVESRTMRDVFEQTVSLTSADFQPPGQSMKVKVVQQEIIEQGWKHYT